MKTAILVSASSEWGGVMPLFPKAGVQNYPYGEMFDAVVDGFPLAFFHTGWGKTSSAGALQFILDRHSPDLVVNLGTCGGFEGGAKVGEVVLVERTVIYDIIELMDSEDVTEYYASSLDLSWLADLDPYPTRRGLIASAEGDLLPEKIALLQSLGAIAADWESATLAWVARKNQARLLILRAVSDMVSAQGGEVYGDMGSYRERAAAIMKMLVGQLPGWLRAVKL
jgi:adenosylhomocysteine nucleosidase